MIDTHQRDRAVDVIDDLPYRDKCSAFSEIRHTVVEFRATVRR